MILGDASVSRFASIGPDCRVQPISGGHFGDLKKWLQDYNFSHRFALILAIRANDADLPACELMESLGEVLDVILAKDPELRVFICEMAPRLLKRSLLVSNIQYYNILMEDLAAKRGLGWLPSPEVLLNPGAAPHYYSKDLIHLNELGTMALVQSWRTELPFLALSVNAEPKQSDESHTALTSEVAQDDRRGGRSTGCFF